MKRKVYSLLITSFALGASYCAHAQIINTIAGGGSGSDGGPASTAALTLPVGVAPDRFGNVYIADNGSQTVRKISATGIISTIAGNGTAGYLGDNGPATDAELNDIACIATDAAGNVYIADWGNNVVRKVTTTGIISTVAGNNTAGYMGDGAAATAAELSGPYGLAVDGSNNLYISDQVNNVIRMVSASTGNISTFAGTGASGNTGDGGPATAAKFAQPFGLTYHGSTLYIADANNSRIRQVSGGNVFPFAGNGLSGSIGDGGAAISAEFNNPRGIAMDANGNMYVADQGNNSIRKIAASLSISTIAGDATVSGSFAGDGGPATAALCNNPINVGVDTNGNVYIADRDNRRVREITGIPTISISGDTTICKGANSTLTDGTPGGTWTSSAPSIATVGSTGIVHGVAVGTAIIAYHVGSDGASRTVIISDCTRAGVSTTNGATDELNVFPNPNDGSFSMNVTSSYDEPVIVTITNMTGAKVKTMELNTNKETQVSLNVPGGMYIINVMGAHSNYVQKIVVAK